MSLILQDLTLPLAEFELWVDRKLDAPVTGITGPSGAGKTTLLELIAGVRKPRKGRITLAGVDLNDPASKCFVAPEKRQIGYVPQDLALFPHLNVMSNLRYGLRSSEGETLLSKVVEMMELGTLVQRSVTALSGGEKQRVALGRALLADPRILLLDEPLSGLDDRLKAKILPYLHLIRSEFRIPMIYVTHSKKELYELCDEVLRMESGRILE
jgi:molybdate transport system ATP-binding protein